MSLMTNLHVASGSAVYEFSSHITLVSSASENVAQYKMSELKCKSNNEAVQCIALPVWAYGCTACKAGHQKYERYIHACN